MPISQDLLEILRCPVSGAPLRSASRAQLRLVNELLESGTLRTEAGSAPPAALDEALLTEDRLRLYPVEDGIPVMLADESIPLDQVDLPAA